MKLTLTLVTVLMAVSAQATTYVYKCKNSGFTINIKLNGKKLIAIDEIEGNGSSRVGNLVFLNDGPKGGSGKMSDQLLYQWSKDDSSIYNWNLPTEFYVQPELLTRGIQLKNGQTGGFISFVGEGYSYETFLCQK